MARKTAPAVATRQSGYAARMEILKRAGKGRRLQRCPKCKLFEVVKGKCGDCGYRV